MEGIILTVAIAALIGAAFVGVIAKMIIDKKRGKASCSCGGNCGACGLCHAESNKEKNS